MFINLIRRIRTMLTGYKYLKCPLCGEIFYEREYGWFLYTFKDSGKPFRFWTMHQSECVCQNCKEEAKSVNRERWQGRYH